MQTWRGTYTSLILHEDSDGGQQGDCSPSLHPQASTSWYPSHRYWLEQLMRSNCQGRQWGFVLDLSVCKDISWLQCLETNCMIPDLSLQYVVPYAYACMVSPLSCTQHYKTDTQGHTVGSYDVHLDCFPLAPSWV